MCIKNEKVNKLLHADDNNKRVHILSLDGGGIRGLIILSILNEIVISSNMSISALFDHIGGTSTGSIIAAGLSMASS